MKTMHYLLAVVGCGGVILLCTLRSSSQEPKSEPSPDRLKQLETRVADLEQRVQQLRLQRENDRLLLRVRGLWAEYYRVEAGKKIRETDEVDWRLETEVSSDRSVLAAVVNSLLLGKMSLDATKDPIQITFRTNHLGKTYVTPGIAEYSYKRLTLALPRRATTDATQVEAIRPKDFRSTPKNGVIVYYLVRPDYKRTGR